MNTKNILVVLMLVALMTFVAFYLGNWAVAENPDGLKLHSPTEKPPAEGSSAFGFGASIGLLGTSLLYCLLAVAVLINSKIRKKPAGKLPIIVAVIAAVGFTTSYIVDGYFY